MADTPDRTTAVDAFERAAESVQARDVRFRREWFYVVASVVAWRVFWELADQNHQNLHAQHLAWIILCLAVWIASIV